MLLLHRRAGFAARLPGLLHGRDGAAHATGGGRRREDGSVPRDTLRQDHHRPPAPRPGGSRDPLFSLACGGLRKAVAPAADVLASVPVRAAETARQEHRLREELPGTAPWPRWRPN